MTMTVGFGEALVYSGSLQAHGITESLRLEKIFKTVTLFTQEDERDSYA